MSDHTRTSVPENAAKPAESHMPASMAAEDLALLAEERRMETVRSRRRNVVIAALAISLVVHVSVMFYLDNLYRLSPGVGQAEPVSIDLMVLQEEELTELESTEFEDLLPDEISQFDQMPEEMPDIISPDMTSASLEVASEGAAPALGGSGGAEGGAGGLSGGGAGTSFFGISSKGTRFAYIVDISGSMGQDMKMQVAMRELAGSISALPDYAYFFITLFETHYHEPPRQRSWMRARPSAIDAVIRWLDGRGPGGGTKPRNAFLRVFSLEIRPDVIFFMTDGEISNSGLGDEIAAMNRAGKRVVINTIAFGDDTSQPLLRQIASESGGVYRFVPTGGIQN